MDTTGKWGGLIRPCLQARWAPWREAFNYSIGQEQVGKETGKYYQFCQGQQSIISPFGAFSCLKSYIWVFPSPILGPRYWITHSNLMSPLLRGWAVAFNWYCYSHISFNSIHFKTCLLRVKDVSFVCLFWTEYEMYIKSIFSCKIWLEM